VNELLELAEAAGLSPRWKDYLGVSHDVSPDSLRAILKALDLPAGSDAEIRESLFRARQPASTLPLLTAVVGEPIAMPVTGPFRLTLEDGTVLDGVGKLPSVDVPGYHTLETGDQITTIAVAPRACHGLPDGKSWGLAVQLYSLRRAGDAGIGDFSALTDFVRAAGKQGARAVAISPIHAQFSADPDRFSPYAPSSRIMLNVLHADAVRGDAALEASDLVDWPAAARARLAQFRALFEAGGHAEEFSVFRQAMGEPLEAHARFETLHGFFFGRDPSLWNWRNWPAEFRHPASPAMVAFAKEHAREISFHAYLQFLADRGWAAAQRAAKDSGMSVGLISDLAVGTDGGGSHCWSRQDETLIGLSVGAPPDLLNTLGQNWGITAFSPRGLKLNGFGAFIEMLRAALRHAGGVRIDHVMGLQRLWVVPDGALSKDGAYLSFPVQDLLRIAALESHRHQAIILGEDLGTVPDGFAPRLIEAGLLGLRVLWFEQNEDKRFRPPAQWSRAATAMTTTHDLPTVAGWWRGDDIFWRQKIGLLADDTAMWFERENRERDRSALWDAFRDSGAAAGEKPPADEPSRAVDAALAHVGSAACELVLLPIEDALARTEQPNLPGTLDEHPNWRRRLPGPATTLLDPRDVSARITGLARARGRG
jgi:4-alpha-glucanotransferase